MSKYPKKFLVMVPLYYEVTVLDEDDAEHDAMVAYQNGQTPQSVGDAEVITEVTSESPDYEYQDREVM